MARASKGARHITVDEVAYRWRASGSDDGVINVIVWPATGPGPTLTASIGYDETWVANTMDGGLRPSRQIVVTNRVVRRMIVFAVSEHGYAATYGHPAVALGRGDGRVDLSDAVRANDSNWYW